MGIFAAHDDETVISLLEARWGPTVLLMCDLCRDSWAPWIHERYIQLARDFDRHAELCQCPQCGSLYEVFPEDKAPPKELTVDEARERFPGALQP
jgi:hypothetical protein